MDGLSLLMDCPEQLEQLLISVYDVTSHNAKWTTSKPLKLQFRKSKFKPPRRFNITNSICTLMFSGLVVKI